MKLSRSIAAYEEGAGWSSHLFFNPFLELLKSLDAEGHDVNVGRTTVHIDKKIKLYVHHNGRSKEYATVTDMKGNELFTAHYTEVDKLVEFVRKQL